MGVASAGRLSLKRSFKSPDEITIEPIYARQDEENEKDSTEKSFCLVSALKACAKRKDLHQGIRIHAEIQESGLLEKSTYLGNTLISMYAKCGALVRAQQVLDGLPVCDVISWSALIAGYAQQGHANKALSCFHRMRSHSLSPNAITYVSVLKACGVNQDMAMGRKIHDEITSQGFLTRNVVLGNALVDMYVKCGVLLKARKVLEELPIRDVISWNVLIAGHAQQGQGQEALGCFQQMQSEGLSPDAISYVCILKACGIAQDVDMGKKIHDEILSQGLLTNNVAVGTALVNMYAKCGVLLKAQLVFEELPIQNVVAWSALIAGYAQQGQGQEALGCFQRMRSEGLSPDAITYACIVKACGIAQDVDMGKKVHDEILSQGLLTNNVVLGNALVDMYVKCGVLLKAWKVLEELPVRDAISWNALIVGHTQQGQGQEALDCFQQMRSEGLSPDAFSYACIVKACGITQDVDMGKKIHEEIVSQRLLKNDVVLGNALVDMYTKCGVCLKAQEVLEELPARNVISWNTLIAGFAEQGQGNEALGCFQRMRSEGIFPDIVSWSALIRGYGQQGLTKEALNCFQRMQQEGLSPSATTFLFVLHACSHSGLVDEAEMYFNSMRERYGVAPDKEHYTCMVDLFGRARLFGKAMGVIKMMPSSDDPTVWYALLGACWKWGNVDLGRLAFEHAIQLDASNAAPYVLMSNIYAAAGMQEEAQNIESMRIENAAWKKPGHSCWVETY